jgi:hypothetical protein
LKGPTININSFKYNNNEKTIETSGIKVKRGNISKTKKKTQLHDAIIHSSSFYNDFSLFENNNDSAEMVQPYRR